MIARATTAAVPSDTGREYHTPSMSQKRGKYQQAGQEEEQLP